MCHNSPTAQLFSSVIAVIGTIMILWHMWKYDKFACLIPRERKEFFRAFIVWALLGSAFCFATADTLASYVKYTEYYIYLPVSGVTIKPNQLYSPHNKLLFHIAYYIITVGWSLLLSVHLEEFLFWAWLLQIVSSKTSHQGHPNGGGRAEKGWVGSVYFKIWLVGCLGGSAIMFGAACIDLGTLTRMEANIFFTGSIISLIMTAGSLWVCVKFPGFIAESRRQGASSEVIGKLNYFRTMNNARTSFRLLYAIVLLILSADGFTKHASINHHVFWVDAFYVLAIFGIFTSMIASLFVLLPRGTGRRSQGMNHVYVAAQDPHPIDSLFPPNSTSSLPSYHSPTMARGDPWSVLGDRLNLEKQDVQELAARHNQSEIDLPFANRQPSEPEGSWKGEADSMDHHARPQEHAPAPPRILQEFRSPLDVGNSDLPPDLRIVMNTVTVAKQD